MHEILAQSREDAKNRFTTAPARAYNGCMPRGPDVIAVAIFLVGLVFSFFAVPWMMKPLHAARITPPPKAQFSISEIFALIVPLIIAATVIFQPFNPQYPGYDSDVPIMAAVTVLGAIYWWLGVRALSRAGVMAQSRRLVYLAVVNPLAYGVSIFFASAPIVAAWIGFGLVGGNIVIAVVTLLPVWATVYLLLCKLFRRVVHGLVKTRPG
jgi:hypothetical protein